MPESSSVNEVSDLDSSLGTQRTPTRKGCLSGIRNLFAVRPQEEKGLQGGTDHSSTPPCWDMNPPEHLKDLPMLPPEEPAPPLRLADRRDHLETRPPVEKRPLAAKKPLRRMISWSEDQINRLQKDNRELRQKILDQKRTEVEKDQTITFLTQQNTQYQQEIDRRNDVTQFANSIIVAVQDFQESQSRQSTKSTEYGDIPPSDGRGSGTMGDMLSDIIRIYSQI
ncbi:uncharacterized protein F4807DRAFT_434036 [Annulohypoxylon truncatum]|uniref:uncharacterized protein n=1 Tax=Annulohypoxylon truncatum TaxID=327061 RepID=UPI00200835D7|nr:uncharacterized protein F4807DRAFT_434036 [Annulohypoxylon truncatum]KAI1207647.1 hypothetical protein F4807DRAFT_434036 [Annulohypoxylon truncatum]